MMKAPWISLVCASTFFGCVNEMGPSERSAGGIVADGGTQASDGAAGENNFGNSASSGSSDAGRHGAGGSPEGGSDGVGGSSCADLSSAGACTGGAVCCAKQDPDDVNPPSFACEPDPGTCTGTADAVVVACRSADDCTGGDVCCGRKAADSNVVYATIRCEPSCAGTYSFDHELFCDPNDAHACDGRPGYPFCEPSDLVPGMYGCSSR